MRKNLFILLTLSNLCLAQLNFSPIKQYTICGTGSMWLANGDINNDSNLDLIVSTNQSQICILTGTGTGSFIQSSSLNIEGYGQCVAVGDLNNDENLDIVVSNSEHDFITVFTGTGIGGFNLYTTYKVGENPTYITLEDLNSDGELDIIVTNYTSNSISILNSSISNPIERTIINYNVGRNSRKVEVADFDKDHLLDLVVPNFNDNTILIFFQNSNHEFVLKDSILPGSGGGTYSVAIGKLNNDEYLDVLVNCVNCGFITFTGTGTGSFNIIDKYYSYPQPFASFVQLKDFDNDGNLDVAASSYIFSQKFRVASGDGNGFFPTSHIINTSGQNNTAIGDYNNDGKPDLAFSGLDQTIGVSLNTTGTPEITDFYPKKAFIEDEITITGYSLSSVTSIVFNGGVEVTPNVINRNTLITTLPSGIKTGTFTLSGINITNLVTKDTLKIKTIKDYDLNIVVTGNLLTAKLDSIHYQWLNCAKGNLPLENSNSNKFIGIPGGSYALEISYKRFKDTSNCININDICGSYITYGDTLVKSDTNLYHSENIVKLSNNGLTLFVFQRPYSLNNSQSFSGSIRVFQLEDSVWKQIGIPLIGKNFYTDRIESFNISSDGNTIALVKEHDYNRLYYKPSTIEIYKFNGLDWALKGQVFTGNSYEDILKVILNKDGNTMAISNLNDDSNASNNGSVTVYTFSGTNWLQKGSVLYGQNFEDQFGFTTCISDDGNTIAVGSRGVDYPSEFSLPESKIFVWNGDDWIQKGNGIKGSRDNRFNGEVRLSSDGNCMAVANYSEQLNSYRIKVYNWDGSSWIQKGEDIPTPSIFEKFKLSSDGSTIAYLTYDNTYQSGFPGFAHIYRWNGIKWTRNGQEIAYNYKDLFKLNFFDLSSDGSRIAVTEFYYNSASHKGYSKIKTFLYFEQPSETLNEIHCDSFIWPANNQIYTTSGIYTTIIPSICPSIQTLNLKIYNSIIETFSVTSCINYTWLENGQTYTTGGVYLFEKSKSGECDTLFKLHLILSDTLDTRLFSTDTSLQVITENGQFQWINCEKDTLIEGEINRFFIPIKSGEYSVQIKQNSCIDTSNCYIINTNPLSIVESIYNINFFLFPNPCDGEFSISLDTKLNSLKLKIYDSTGRPLYENNYENTQLINVNFAGPSGFYIVELISKGNDYRIFKLFKK